MLLSCESKLRYTFMIDLLNNNYVTCGKQPFRGSNYQLNMYISNHCSSVLNMKPIKCGIQV